MRKSRCAAHCPSCHDVNRRTFLLTTSLGTTLLAGTAPGGKVVPHGPASRCVPTIKACFVRREGDYGLRWPGAVYDGDAALKRYRDQIEQAARELKIKLDLTAAPLYSLDAAEAWIAGATAARPDGLLIVLLDRQEHAWPTAAKAIDTGLPTVVFSPVGTSFTTNTAPLAKKPNSVIISTDDFRPVRVRPEDDPGRRPHARHALPGHRGREEPRDRDGPSGHQAALSSGPCVFG